MNVAELQECLKERGIRNNTVSFDGMQTAAEQFFIVKSGNVWEVYYYERGNKNRLRQFVDEQAACEYLLQLLLDDKTVWIKQQ